jgi:uncharacterized metal-binding protein YceD (DUF177 family)
MFTFKIFEIPDGKSERTLRARSEDLDLKDVELNQADIHIQFERGLHFIRTLLHINAQVTLICDRSLDPFIFTIDKDFEILFKEDATEESTDEKSAVRSIDTASQEIDIEQDVLDTILVHLPVKKLHPRFLDEHGQPIDFVDQQFGADDQDSEQDEHTDPRWDALKKLKN